MQFNDIGIMGRRVPGTPLRHFRLHRLWLDEGSTLRYRQDLCLNCGACQGRCTSGAVRVLAEGVTLFIGGTAGRRVMAGLPFGPMVPLSLCSALIDAVLTVYQKYGEPGERLRSMMGRVGSELVLSTVREVVLDPSFKWAG